MIKKSLLSFPDCSPDDFAILNYLRFDKGCDIIPEILKEDVSKIFHLSQQDIWYSLSITAFLPENKMFLLTANPPDST